MFTCKCTLAGFGVLSLLIASNAFVFPSFQGKKQSAMIRMALSAPKPVSTVTLLPGDGIGPEITAATVAVLERLSSVTEGMELEFREALIGGAAVDATGDPFPAATLEACQTADSVLLACIGGPKWDACPREQRPESGLLAMRKSMNLFANLRPAKVLPQLVDASTLKKEVIEGVDIMVVRELVGDVYFGAPKGITTDPETGEKTGFNNMIYSESEVKRIAKVAFDVAQKRRGEVCSIDKANVLDVSQLWRDTVIDVHKDYPDVTLSHMYVDNAAMQLVRWPKQFDVIVCGNLFGDILSDEASMLVGSLGLLPSASLGTPDTPGVFEPIHGSAPDIAGSDTANPLAMILSTAMMLQYDLARPDQAEIIENAVLKVLDDGFRTVDIYDEGHGQVQIGCKEMGEKVADAVAALVAQKS